MTAHNVEAQILVNYFRTTKYKKQQNQNPKLFMLGNEVLFNTEALWKTCIYIRSSSVVSNNRETALLGWADNQLLNWSLLLSFTLNIAQTWNEINRISQICGTLIYKLEQWLMNISIGCVCWIDNLKWNKSINGPNIRYADSQIFTREAYKSLAVCQPLLSKIHLLLCRTLIHSNVLEMSAFQLFHHKECKNLFYEITNYLEEKYLCFCFFITLCMYVYSLCRYTVSVYNTDRPCQGQAVGDLT